MYISLRCRWSAHACLLLSLIIFAPTLSFSQPAPKLLYIGIDGLRPDALLAADTPALDSLLVQGFLATDARCEDLTFSGPNWSTILHGIHRDKHNVTTNNYENSRLDQYPDLFALLEAHNPDWNTVRITTWDAIYKFQPTGTDIDIFHEYSRQGDELAAKDAAALLAGTHPDHPQLDVDALFLYIADVDEGGHAHGFHPESPQYLDAIHTADRQVGLVLDAMRSRPDFDNENWLVIMTSDHGGSLDGSHSGNTPEKRTIPFLLSGPDVVRAQPFPAPANIDGVPTALVHMGVPITDDMRLDGRPVGLEPSQKPHATLGKNLIFNPGAELDSPATSQHIHRSLAGWHNPGPGGVTAVAYGSPNGYPTPLDPGPDTRGKAFFCGGGADRTIAVQRIDLTPLADVIDAPNAFYTLSASLGGYAAQDDSALIRVRWLDAHDKLLGTTQIGPVTASDRKNTTGLLPQQTTDTPPKMARYAEVEIECHKAAGGGNDGYADNLSLIIFIKKTD